MPSSHRDFDMGQLEELARKLEEAFRQANDLFLRAADTSPEQVVDELADLQCNLLRLDDFSKKKFLQEIEDKRVRSLSAGNIFMAAVLTSAVGLTTYKNKPRIVSRRASKLEAKIEAKLREYSTTTPALLTLSSVSLQTFLTSRIAKKALKVGRNKALMAFKKSPKISKSSSDSSG